MEGKEADLPKMQNPKARSLFSWRGILNFRNRNASLLYVMRTAF